MPLLVTQSAQAYRQITRSISLLSYGHIVFFLFSANSGGLHSWGVFTFLLCFRSKVATEFCIGKFAGPVLVNSPSEYSVSLLISKNTKFGSNKIVSAISNSHRFCGAARVFPAPSFDADGSHTDASLLWFSKEIVYRAERVT